MKKETLIATLTAGAFLLAPPAFAGEGMQTEKDATSTMPHRSAESMPAEKADSEKAGHMGAEKDMKAATQPRSSDSFTSDRAGDRAGTTGESAGSMAERSKAAESSAQKNTESAAQVGQSKSLKVSEMIGYTVRNPEGQELGEIEELVIDPANGRIAYAVLSFGGFLGMGDKYFAVPWEALKPMPTQNSFSLNMDKEKLENAPGFDKNNWPDLADREWNKNVHRFYNLEPR